MGENRAMIRFPGAFGNLLTARLEHVTVRLKHEKIHARCILRCIRKRPFPPVSRLSRTMKTGTFTTAVHPC